MVAESAAASSPWRLIDAADFAVPAAAAQHRLRRGWRSWLERMGGVRDAAPQGMEFEAVAEARLQALLPELPVATQREAVLAALEETGGRLLVLRPPDGSWDAALQGAAEVLAERGWQSVAAPAARPPEVAPPRIGEAGVALVELERWFLRHHDGLAICRELLARLEGASGGLLVGCDAWAWRFLSEALAAGVRLPAARLPAPLDGAAARAWIAPSTPLRLRGSGAPPDEGFYRALAAEARGLPGVVRELWGSCLRRGAAAEPAAAGREGTEAALWLQAPSEAAPTAAGTSREALLLLHALLLHGGMTAAELARTVPLSEERLAILAHQLRGAQLIEARGARLRARPVGYPAGRGRLEEEGFLVAVP